MVDLDAEPGALPGRHESVGDPEWFGEEVVGHVEPGGEFAGSLGRGPVGTPDGNLRARFRTSDDGAFEIHTVVPAPYMIPHDGPTGQLLAAGGWHPWRPAHLHYFVDADGHDRLTTQLFFAGDRWLGTDVAGADKAELVLEPVRNGDGELEVTYDFVLQPGSARREAISAAH